MDFQTHPDVAAYMADMVPINCGVILEPTPGMGNLVAALTGKGRIVAPKRFEDIGKDQRFDYVVMNPPFTPMKEGYRFLTEAMRMSNNVIALLPWLSLINSERRTAEINDFGLVSITHLPRKAFPGSRVQCCVLELRKGYKGETKFKLFPGTL